MHVGSIAELERALDRAKEATGPFVVVIDTDPYPSTPHGGTWWEVAVPEVSDRREVNEKRAAYEAALKERSGA
jgi:3D-(3,5/4)-trihydroxycyclohexane-1,2-dione acylhydrolase (decyclizing)